MGLKDLHPGKAAELGLDETEALVDLTAPVEVPKPPEEDVVEAEESDDPDEYMKRFVHEMFLERCEPVREGMLANKEAIKSLTSQSGEN